MEKKLTIGGYKVEDIEMLDKDTCVLCFEAFKEGDVQINIIVEKWLDEGGSWHFTDNIYSLNGDFLDTEKSTHLLEEDKEKCKEYINNWLEGLNK